MYVYTKRTHFIMSVRGALTIYLYMCYIRYDTYIAIFMECAAPSAANPSIPILRCIIYIMYRQAGTYPIRVQRRQVFRTRCTNDDGDDDSSDEGYDCAVYIQRGGGETF